MNSKSSINYIKWFPNTKKKKRHKVIKTTTTVIKLKLKIFSNVRGQYLYSRDKPRSINFKVIQKNDSFSFFWLKISDNDARSDDTMRSIIAFAIRWQQNSAVKRILASVLKLK